MSNRFLALAILFAVVAPAAGQTPAAKKAWTAPLTRDGQPDLQGVWLSNSATPLERPKALEGREFLTEAEVADLKKRAAKLFKDGNSDACTIRHDERPHVPPHIRQWNGDSRGRWEGKTLVVDTTNLSTQSYFMGSAENLHLAERFTRVVQDKLKYEVTLDDPTTWTK